MQLQTKLPKVGTTIFTVMSQLAMRHGAINLGQGFPDFDVPEFLRESMARHMLAGRNQYAPMSGVPALREAIAAKTAELYGRMPDVDHEITVTSGATEAIFAAIHASVRAGEEVIVFDPAYDCYEPAIELAGARCVHLRLRPGDFSIDLDALRAAINPRTRMLILNSPHNPSGALVTRAELDAIAEMLRGTEILLLSDEVYEHIVFDGKAHLSAWGHPELRERSFVVSSFGKTFHCTGWKLGYCVAPAALSAEFRKVHQYLTFCSFNAAQWAFADMLREHPAHWRELPAFYAAKRDHFAAALAGSRFKLRPVGGSYFQIADYSAISQADDRAFCEWLTETHKVAAIPLSPFYAEPEPGQRLVRFCFAKNESTLSEAAERLCAI